MKNFCVTFNLILFVGFAICLVVDAFEVINDCEG